MQKRRKTMVRFVNGLNQKGDQKRALEEEKSRIEKTPKTTQEMHEVSERDREDGGSLEERLNWSWRRCGANGAVGVGTATSRMNTIDLDSVFSPRRHR